MFLILALNERDAKRTYIYNWLHCLKTLLWKKPTLLEIRNLYWRNMPIETPSTPTKTQSTPTKKTKYAIQIKRRQPWHQAHHMFIKYAIQNTKTSSKLIYAVYRKAIFCCGCMHFLAYNLHVLKLGWRK